MAIIVGENAYVTLTDFRAWAALRGFALTSFLGSQIEAAIVVATLDYIEPNYQFKGDLLDTAQALNLPTDEVSIDDVQNPVCYTVYQCLQGNLFVDLGTIGTQEVTSQTDTLGELSQSVTYREGSQLSYKKSTQKIDRLFKPFVRHSGFGLGILRG